MALIENGVQAPDFELPSQFGESVRLSSFAGRASVALVFFPLAFSGICQSELCELRDNIEMFAEDGVELLAVSVDSKHTLRAWSDQEGYEFTLLADFWPHGAVAEAYGVFLPERGVANRATFLIDQAGRVAASFVTAPGQARSIAAYREALSTMRAAR